MTSCAIDECVKPSLSRGWCGMHYARWRRCGTTEGVGKGRPRGTTVTYHAIHLRLKADRGRAAEFDCAECGDPAAEWAYDHSDPGELRDGRGRRFSADVWNYSALCIPCHRRIDRGVLKTTDWKHPNSWGGSTCFRGHDLNRHMYTSPSGKRRCQECHNDYRRRKRAEADETPKGLRK